MDTAKTACLYLEEPLLQSAVAGRHNFINLVVEVLEAAHLGVRFADVSAQSHVHPYALTHMAEPVGEHGLVFRRAYHYPFWQIDRVAARWNWMTAQAAFNPDRKWPDASRFYAYWQNRLFGDAPQNATRDNLIYVPLQARLSEHRRFQTTSPLEMVAHCITHADGRNVVVGLHPKVRYSQAEMDKLDRLVDQHPNVQVAVGRSEYFLQRCAFVVTQNSSVAFDGYLFGKPALLFADIDFHHIGIKADLGNMAQSFETVSTHQPPFERYLWWFWQEQCINAGRPNAKMRIAEKLRSFGWPIP